MFQHAFIVAAPAVPAQHTAFVCADVDEATFDNRLGALCERFPMVKRMSRRTIKPDLVEFLFSGPARDRKQFLLELMGFPANVPEHDFLFRVSFRAQDQPGLLDMAVLAPFDQAKMGVFSICGKTFSNRFNRNEAEITFGFGLDSGNFKFLANLAPQLMKFGRFRWCGIFQA